MPVEASFTIGYHKMRTFCILGSCSKRLIAKEAVLHAYTQTQFASQHVAQCVSQVTVTAAAAVTHPSFHSTDSEYTLQVSMKLI